MAETARELLEIEVAELERKLARKRSILTQLQEDEAETGAVNGVIIRPNEFAGLEKVQAVIKFLQMTGRAHANLTDEVVPALLRGGADLGKDKDRHARNLKIAVRMNSKRADHPLVWDSETDMVSIRAMGRSKARSA